HYGLMYNGGSKPTSRVYPFPMISMGSGYTGVTQNVQIVGDPEVGGSAKVKANIQQDAGIKWTVGSYSLDDPTIYTDPTRRFSVRPLAYITDKSVSPATAQVTLNDDGYVVRVLHGPVPLWGSRRGEDVMMTDALAFDLRVFDPGAPLYA